VYLQLGVGFEDRVGRGSSGLMNISPSAWFENLDILHPFKPVRTRVAQPDPSNFGLAESTVEAPIDKHHARLWTSQAEAKSRNSQDGHDAHGCCDSVHNVSRRPHPGRPAERKGERWLALQGLSNCQARVGQAIRSTVWLAALISIDILTVPDADNGDYLRLL
jgi:hypothetical protein